MQELGIITTSYPTGTPGSEAAGSFVHDFACEVSKSIKVTVFAPDYKESREEVDNLTIQRFAVPRLPLSTLNSLNPFHWPAIIRTLQSGYRSIYKTISDSETAHIFALWAIPSGYWASRLKIDCGISYSIWALGSDIWNMRDKPLISRVLRKILVNADFRFADGIQLAKDVTEITGGLECSFLPSSRIFEKVHQRNKNIDPPYNLAYLGRWHLNKGVDILMDSLNNLENREWERISQLRVYGGGLLEKQVNDSVSRFQKEGRPVISGGYLSKEDAMELLDWADFLLIPSRIESIPVVFSDALQSGTPVIASPAGDLPDIIRKYKCGLLADQATAGAFADALKMALTIGPGRFNSGIKAARENFDIRRTANKFIGLIFG